MEQVDFTLYPEPSIYFLGNVLVGGLMCSLVLAAWALFSIHHRRPDHGAWGGTGFYAAALMPVIVGLGWTLFRFNGAVETAARMGSRGAGATASAAAGALFTTELGFGISAAIVASTWFWIRRFPAAAPADSTLPGTWLIGSVLGAVFLAQGGVVVITMRLTARNVNVDAVRELILALAFVVAALAIIALAAVRHAPRGRAIPRRAHAVVAGTLVVLLAASGTVTCAAVEHCLDVSRHGCSSTRRRAVGFSREETTSCPRPTGSTVIVPSATRRR